MHVVFTLAVLYLRSLFRKALQGESARPQKGTHSATESQESHRPVVLPGPTVMFGARKPWDLSHSPRLQEMWRKDDAQGASLVDFPMSDSEDSTLIQTSVLPSVCVTSDLPNPGTTGDQRMLIQTLQDKVCEIQSRLRCEDTGRRLQHLRPDQWQEAAGLCAGARNPSLTSEQEKKGLPQEEVQLGQQVEALEEKLVERSREVARLRSELGATDLEKHLEILVCENERLKQDLSACQYKDVESLRCQLAHRDAEAEERERRLALLREEASRAAEKRQRLEQRLQDSVEAERAMGHRLRDCQQALAQQVNYMSQSAELELAQYRQALSEAQAHSHSLQEQLVAQRGQLQQLEQQLQESERANSQLQVQILAYENEMERTQSQLEAEMQSVEEEKNRIIEEAFTRAESEMKAVHDNLAGVQMNLLTLQPALRTLTYDYNSLKRQVQDFPLMLKKAMAEAKKEICQVIGEVSSANQELLRKYKREMNLRKKCHNELVRLKGNIRVFCRVQPLPQEQLHQGRSVVTFDPNDDALLSLAHKGKLMAFELDRVFPPQASQEEVFQEVQSLITSCIDGYNVCIFAYGQTGSGKTYTMEGVEENPGINQRALRLLFSEVSEKVPDWDFSIRVSMVEIYNETLRDLLGDSPSDKLDIKLCPDGSGQLYVPGLTEIPVKSVEDINLVFELGHVNRATACTSLNDRSSRSHALLIVTVCGINATAGTRCTGKLNLVDLAGSERIAKSGAEGSRLREAQCINKSLSALGDVIHALRCKQGHVPFRNSRLTYLLQDSLSGDSKTLMMVQISPLDSNASESVCSLKFAQRVRTVELGGPSSRRHGDNSSTSSSPTHDSLEIDSPPVTPVTLPLSRASSAGSTLGTRTPGLTRRRSPSRLSSGKAKVAA